MLRVLSGLAVGAVVVLAGGACSAIQDSLSCPGEDCPPALRSVRDEVSDLPGVTSVDRTWRFENIDRGPGGGVDLHASIATKAEAARLAASVRDVYDRSDVEPVDRVTVVVVPDPERRRAEVYDAVLVGDETTASPACAADRCADEVAAFEDAFADDAATGTATLESARWSAQDDGPATRIEVTAPDRLMAPEELDAFEGRILDLARSAGLTHIGDVRTVIHYRSRVEFSFVLDMRNSAPR